MLFKESQQTPGLSDRSFQAAQILKKCEFCPNRCKVDRVSGETGDCKAGLKVKIASVLAHHGEEPPVSGTRGSGTIFFSYCPLHCRFCQNFQISQLGQGYEVSEEELADLMLDLQVKGCHNINLVSPTQYLAQILSALEVARKKGLILPVVYNTNGYETMEMLKLLDGIIDIYLPDIKYSSDAVATKLSGARKYVEHNRRALIEMHRQVGDLQCDSNGIAVRGLLVRHLVLPDDMAGSYESLKFLSENLGKEVHLSIMAQYHPCYKAGEDVEIGRRITASEYHRVLLWLEEFGLNNCFVQELASSDIYLPDFEKQVVFRQETEKEARHA